MSYTREEGEFDEELSGLLIGRKNIKTRTAHFYALRGILRRKNHEINKKDRSNRCCYGNGS